MANKYNEKKKKSFLTRCLLVFILAVCCGVSIIFSKPIEKALKIGDNTASIGADVSVVNQGKLKIHYISVGQGDSTLIELPDGTTMLIDAGTPDEKLSANLVNYIKGVVPSAKINYLILTHSDDDHSGGMPEILKNFEIQNIFRPFQIACTSTYISNKNWPKAAIAEDDLAGYFNTDCELTDENNWFTGRAINQAYRDFIKNAYTTEEWTNEDTSVVRPTITVSFEGLVISSRNASEEFSINFYAPLIDDSADLGGGHFIAGVTQTLGRPVKHYTGKNNASPIMLLEYKEKSFVFTGDAEKQVENDFLNKYKTNTDVAEKFKNVDVYKAGHHGSYTSSTANFLAFLNPSYTVVSCGKNNSYKHPSAAFLERWEAQVSTQGTARKQTEPLRTDINDTIIFAVLSDGQLVYTAGVVGDAFVIYWWYIALGIFAVGTIIIFTTRVYKNNAVKTAKSAVKSTKKAQKIVDKYK